MWEGDRIFLELIAKNEPYFDLKLVYKGESLVSAILNGKAIR
jgi:8-oxo-dGTP diphosphatase